MAIPPWITPFWIKKPPLGFMKEGKAFSEAMLERKNKGDRLAAQQGKKSECFTQGKKKKRYEL